MELGEVQAKSSPRGKLIHLLFEPCPAALPVLALPAIGETDGMDQETERTDKIADEGGCIFLHGPNRSRLRRHHCCCGRCWRIDGWRVTAKSLLNLSRSEWSLAERFVQKTL